MGCLLVARGDSLTSGHSSNHVASLLRSVRKPSTRGRSKRESQMRRDPIMRVVSALILLAFTMSSVLAHDFWLELDPSATDGLIDVSLHVGDEFPGDEFPRDPTHLRKFAVIDADGARDLPGRDGRAPAGFLRTGRAGAHWVVYESAPRKITLEATKFERYLREDGLEHAAKERVRLGETDIAGREAYSRFAKSWMVFDGELDTRPAPSFDEPIGLRLEIVPLEDPSTSSSDGRLPVKVLFHGKPVEGVRVRARKRAPVAESTTIEPSVETSGSAESVPIAARTDAEGRATLELGREDGGESFWLVACVHMVRAVDTDQSDWESSWASLTFVRRDAGLASVRSSSEAEVRVEAASSTAAAAK
jgi:hypothetical protein